MSAVKTCLVGQPPEFDPRRCSHCAPSPCFDHTGVLQPVKGSAEGSPRAAPLAGLGYFCWAKPDAECAQNLSLDFVYTHGALMLGQHLNL